MINRFRDGDPAPATRPFQKAGLLPRVGPFVATAVVVFALVPLGDVMDVLDLWVAAGLIVALIVAIFGVRWDSLPRWTDAVVPLVYLVVVAVLREAEGGQSASVNMLVLLPVVWFALFGTRAELVVSVVGSVAIFVLPAIFIGEPRYPATEIFRGTIIGVVTSMVAFVVHRLVAERTRLVGHLEVQAKELRQILETAHDAYVSIDADGRIQQWNARAEAIFGWAPEDVLGLRLTETIIPHRYRDAHARGIERFRNTGVGTVLNQRLELTALHRHGWEFPIELVIWPVVSGERMTFSASIHDIRDRKRAEGYRDAQRDVAIALATSTTLPSALPPVLRAIGDHLHWDHGAIWLIDEHDEDLRCVATWHPGRPELDRFATVCTETRLPRGVGLPGLAWARGELMTADEVDRSNMPRGAEIAKASLLDAIAVPLTVDGQVAGVIEFFTADPLPVDRELRDMMSSIGAQVAQFVERTRVEAALAEGEARYRRLADQLGSAQQIARLGSWEWEPTSSVLSWSDELYRIYGYEPQSFTPTFERFLAGIHVDDRAAVAAVIGAASENGEAFEFDHRIVRPDGSVRSLHCLGEAVVGPSGTVERMSGTGEDITERARAAAELAASEERFRSLATSAPIGVFETDSCGQWTYANGRLQEIMRLDAEKVLGDGWAGAIVPAERARVLATWRAAASAELKWSDRFRIHTPEGSTRWIDVRAAALHDQSQRLTGFVGTIADVTKTIRAEQVLERTRDEALEASRVKSEFLANMSHEIRTPLNGVLGIADLMFDGDLDEEQVTHLATLRDSGRNLLEIINDVLDFSKGAAGKLELDTIEFDLRETVTSVTSVLASQARQKGLELELEIADDVPGWVRGDSPRLRRILINLLSNAIKFTDVGGVEVQVTVPAEGHIRLEVSDTGIGIDEVSRARILEPFTQAEASTTRRYGGTGLGLSICRQLIELMGGTLEFDSEPGLGSTFSVGLPLETLGPRATPLRSPPTSSRPAPCHAGRGGRVLVVEDAPVNQLVATAMLRRLGYEPEVVGNGAAAVEAVRGGTYDVILMDCLMPVMDGFQATERIRAGEASNAHVPIIALTASAMAGDREKCLRAGMDDYLSKPFDRASLAETLDRCLSGEDPASTAPGPEGGEPDAPGPLDDALEALQEQIGDAAFRAVREAFLTTVPSDFVALERAVADGASARSAAIAHKLKGSSASIGAERLRELMRRVETDLEGPDAAAALGRARAELELVITSIRGRGTE